MGGHEESDDLQPPSSSWHGWTCDEITPDLCDLVVEEGDVPVRGGLSVHYWRYSGAKLSSGNHGVDEERDACHGGGGGEGTLLPVVALHGGPAWPHNYMLPLKQLACRGRDVVFYDQAGCGASLLPHKTLSGSTLERYPWLGDPSYYATEELPAVLNFLGYDGYHLFGHSWGSMLAQQFALDNGGVQAPGPRSMILSGPISDSPLLARAQWDEVQGKSSHGGIGSWPPYMRQRLRAVEAQRDFQSPEYTALDDAFLASFVSRTQPIPGCFRDALDGVNVEIMEALAGPNDFELGGALADFNVTPRLHEIDVPVLLMAGEYDFVRPAVVDAIQDNLPFAERMLLSKSAHNSMLDEPGLMNDAISDFMLRVEESHACGHRVKPTTLAAAATRSNLGAIDSLLRKDMYVEEQTTRLQHAFLLTVTFLVGAIIGAVSTGRSRRWRYNPIVETI